jgi:hypothetical protein
MPGRGRWLVVIAVVMVLTGVVAAEASATAWKVAGKEFTGTETEAVVKTTEAPLLNIPSLSFPVQCASAGLEKGAIKGPAGGSATSLVLINCVPPLPSHCQIRSSAGTGVVGRIESFPLNYKLQTIGGSVYKILTPVTGTGFFSFVIEGKLGEFCAIAGKELYTGSTAFKMGSAEALELSGEDSEAVAKASGAGLHAGGEPEGPTAYLTTKLAFNLTGANKGQKWGVIP